MRYKALWIKNWIIREVSPFGWATLITRAMPELLEFNQRFSAYYINERTTWSQTEVDIVNWYLKKMYKIELPVDELIDNGFMEVNYMELVGISFFDTDGRWKDIGKKILGFFKF